MTQTVTALAPRLMVVDSIVTCVPEKRRTLGLLLLSRKASADFDEQVNKRDSGNVRSYARAHAIRNLCQDYPASGFQHRSTHDAARTNYHLGGILTEREARDSLGYVEPFADTVCGRIAQLQHENAPLRRFICEELITTDQTIVIERRVDTINLHVIDDRIKQQFRDESTSKQTDRNRPITLVIFEPDSDGLMPVGCTFYHPPKNMIYEFITYVPVK